MSMNEAAMILMLCHVDQFCRSIDVFYFWLGCIRDHFPQTFQGTMMMATTWIRPFNLVVGRLILLPLGNQRSIQAKWMLCKIFHSIRVEYATTAQGWNECQSYQGTHDGGKLAARDVEEEKKAFLEYRTSIFG